MASKRAPQNQDAPDFNGFPPGMVTRARRTVCLKCVYEFLTKGAGLKARTASGEIRNHALTVDELATATLARPYFQPAGSKAHCPYCDSATRWHAVLPVWRIEGRRITDAPRRKLVEGLKEGDYQVLEAKTTQTGTFFDWLQKLSHDIDFERPGWLAFAARRYLERKAPKTDWRELFGEVRAVRRSSRLEEGWEIDAGRLFLSPELYSEVLLVQYLASRAHLHGGMTLEGRLTLHELMQKLRHWGYFREHEIQGEDQGEILEKLVAHLSGEGSAKYHYIVDRRELVAKAKDLAKSVKDPKPKKKK